MEIGEVKPKQLLWVGIVILVLIGLGYWVSRTTPDAPDIPPNVAGPTSPPPMAEKEQPPLNIDTNQVFIPLGETSIAIKLPSEYIIEEGSLSDEGSVIRASIQDINSEAVYSIQISTLADVKSDESSLTEEDFLSLLQAYQRGDDLDGYSKYTFKNRLYYFESSNDRQVFRTFFGDNYLGELASANLESDSLVPSQEVTGFLEGIQFTSKFFSRSGLTEVFKRLFSEKYLISHQDVEINDLWVTEKFARGEVSVTTTEGENAGLFFAVRINNEWQAVFDGNGSYPCSMLEFHAFPLEMQEGCR